MWKRIVSISLAVRVGYSNGLRVRRLRTEPLQSEKQALFSLLEWRKFGTGTDVHDSNSDAADHSLASSDSYFLISHSRFTPESSSPPQRALGLRALQGSFAYTDVSEPNIEAERFGERFRVNFD